MLHIEHILFTHWNHRGAVFNNVLSFLFFTPLLSPLYVRTMIKHFPKYCTVIPMSLLHLALLHDGRFSASLLKRL